MLSVMKRSLKVKLNNRLFGGSCWRLTSSMVRHSNLNSCSFVSDSLGTRATAYYKREALWLCKPTSAIYTQLFIQISSVMNKLDKEQLTLSFCSTPIGKEFTSGFAYIIFDLAMLSCFAFSSCNNLFSSF